MRSIEECYVPLHEVLCTVLQLPADRVILANQGRGAPPGTEAYATYWPEPIRAHGWPIVDQEDVPAVEPYDPTLGGHWTDLRHTLRVNMLLSVTVNVYNADAQTRIMRLVHAHFRPDISSLLHTHRLGWQSVSNIRNLTHILQAGIQPRFNIDIDLWSTFETTVDVLRAAGTPFTLHDTNNHIISEG